MTAPLTAIPSHTTSNLRISPISLLRFLLPFLRRYVVAFPFSFFLFLFRYLFLIAASPFRSSSSLPLSREFFCLISYVSSVAFSRFLSRLSLFRFFACLKGMVTDNNTFIHTHIDWHYRGKTWTRGFGMTWQAKVNAKRQRGRRGEKNKKKEGFSIDLPFLSFLFFSNLHLHASCQKRISLDLIFPSFSFLLRSFLFFLAGGFEISVHVAFFFILFFLSLCLLRADWLLTHPPPLIPPGGFARNQNTHPTYIDTILCSNIRAKACTSSSLHQLVLRVRVCSPHQLASFLSFLYDFTTLLQTPYI